MDPDTDPGSPKTPKTYGSDGSGSATLKKTLKFGARECQISAYRSLRNGGRKVATAHTCLFRGSRPHRRLGSPASPFLEPPHDLEKHIFAMDDKLTLAALRVHINFAIFDFKILRPV
jgi:hypothetical protein